MNKEQPTYYAIIPANVRYSTELKANEKLLYGEITALTNKNGICYASNKYFANLYNVSKVAISGWISNLERQGFVDREIIYADSSKEILNRYLRIIVDPIKENFNTPIKENFKENNTSINNTSINNKKNIIKKEKGETSSQTSKFIVPDIKEVEDYIKEKGYSVKADKFWHFYNSKNWYVGKNKMRNWKSAVATWNKDTEPKKENPAFNKRFTTV